MNDNSLPQQLHLPTKNIDKMSNEELLFVINSTAKTCEQLKQTLLINLDKFEEVEKKHIEALSQLNSRLS